MIEWPKSLRCEGFVRSTYPGKRTEGFVRFVLVGISFCYQKVVSLVLKSRLESAKLHPSVPGLPT